MPTANEHSKAMAQTIKDINNATDAERKELLTKFYGSASVGIDKLFPGTGLGYGFAKTQIDRINTQEIEE